MIDLDWTSAVSGEGLLPVVDPTEQIMLYISNCTAAQLLGLSSGPRRYPFPISQMVQQATSDRLSLAGEHLRAGDHALLGGRFRSSISRHYYAMYHAARAVVFGVTSGDDHERHSVLPRNLPTSIANHAQRENELTAARLLRNEADYDPYPSTDLAWEQDARGLAVVAAEFVQEWEDFALTNGLI